MRLTPYSKTQRTTPPFPVKRFCCVHRRFERPIYARAECPAKASCMNCRLLRAPAQPPCAGGDGPECENQGGKTECGAARSRTPARSLPQPPRPPVNRCASTLNPQPKPSPISPSLRLPEAQFDSECPGRRVRIDALKNAGLFSFHQLWLSRRFMQGPEIARSSE